MSPAELHALSASLIRSWHPDLRAPHAMADVEETFAVRIRTSPVIAAWPASRVTVLGDAIHAMRPAGGSGANTALRDAARLCRALTAAADDITAAIGDYENQMRDYGYAALAASAKAEAERGALRNPLLSWLFRRARPSLTGHPPTPTRPCLPGRRSSPSRAGRTPGPPRRTVPVAPRRRSDRRERARSST